MHVYHEKTLVKGLRPPSQPFTNYRFGKGVRFYIPSYEGGLFSIPPPWGRLVEGRHIVKHIPMQMAFPLPASPKGEGMVNAFLLGNVSLRGRRGNWGKREGL